MIWKTKHFDSCALFQIIANMPKLWVLSSKGQVDEVRPTLERGEDINNIWKCLEIFGNIWKCLEMFGNIWKYFEL